MKGPVHPWTSLPRHPLGRGLLTLYGVGLVGHMIPWAPVHLLMTWLTPAALLVGGAITIWSDLERQKARRVFLIWFVFVMLAGFAAEAAGVATGRVFGAYSYGQVLGPKILGVPPVIALNWAVLTLGAARLARLWFPSRWIFPWVAGLLLAAFDLLLEPAAIHFGYWVWEDLLPPLQNFVAWGVLGAFFSAFLPGRRLAPQEERLAPFGLLVQALYFAALFVRFDLF